MKGMMGGLYRISEWIMRFSVTNILWLVSAIPFFFLVLVTLSIETEDLSVVGSTLIFMAIVAPFTLFPSTTAMFSLARKWIIGEEDAPLLKTFFKSYKQNYLQSMLGGLIYTVIFAVMIVNYRFYINQEGYVQLFSVLFIMFMVITSISMFNFFCVLAHLHMKTLSVIKNSILVTIGKPFTSIFMVITNIFIVYVCFTYFNLFLVFFFMGSLIAYMTFYHFHRMFEKIQAKQREYEEKQANEQISENGEQQALVEDKNLIDDRYTDYKK